ncbi:Pam3-gp28 family putative phage holin [Methylobacterium sp. ID0610]|uniref:Pam3-gp28 family putative phage holin n=1 Tax=Methylobacterium carpenticola TaxID=3344827 RepID=UPI0036ACB3C7
MNQEQLLSLARTLLQIGGALAVARGWISAEQMASLTDQLIIAAGALVMIGTTIWGLVARSKKNLVAAAAALPEVAEIKASAPIASAVPSDKVQPVTR